MDGLVLLSTTMNLMLFFCLFSSFYYFQTGWFCARVVLSCSCSKKSLNFPLQHFSCFAVARLCHLEVFNVRTLLREMRASKWKTLFDMIRTEEKAVEWNWNWVKGTERRTQQTKRCDEEKNKMLHFFECSARPTVAFYRLSHSRFKKSAFFHLCFAFIVSY